MTTTHRSCASLLLTFALAALGACAADDDPGVAAEPLAAAPAPDPAACTSWQITHYCPTGSEGGCMDAHDQPVCTTQDVRDHKPAVCNGKSRTCDAVTVACDPAKMKNGTCFHIEGSDLTYCCTDVGSAIKGCHLDVAIDCGTYGDFDNRQGVTIEVATAAAAAP
jgi:3D (Asp-Asp-Asp) domain-containing protein